MKSSGISHKEKGGRLPLLLQAEVKAPPESLHERTIWLSSELGIRGLLWVRATADEYQWAVSFVVIYLQQEHKCAPLTVFITLPGGRDE